MQTVLCGCDHDARVGLKIAVSSCLPTENSTTSPHSHFSASTRTEDELKVHIQQLIVYSY